MRIKHNEINLIIRLCNQLCRLFLHRRLNDNLPALRVVHPVSHPAQAGHQVRAGPPVQAAQQEALLVVLVFVLSRQPLSGRDKGRI